MKAIKGNKVYTIDETQVKSYQDSGFDITGDDGEVISYGRGKTVPYEEYIRAATEIERLQNLLTELQTSGQETGAEQEAKQEDAESKKTKRAGE